MKYPVMRIFRSLQGEGRWVGHPTTFVRLAGCSVAACAIRKECDEAPWKATEHLDEHEILARVEALGSRSICCITGGEPTDHDLVPLIDVLRRIGRHTIHLETSGVRPVEIPIDWLTVSPRKAGRSCLFGSHTHRRRRT